MQKFTYVVKDELGIHARPAGQLAKEAKKFESKIMVGKGGKSFAATKVMGIMSLCAKCGDEVEITAEGADEEAAIEGMKAFFAENL